MNASTDTGVPPMSAPQEDPPARGRRPLGAGLALIVAGLLWLAAVAGANLPWDLLLALAIVTVGVVVLFGGARRRGRGADDGGPVWLGVVLVVVAFVVPIAPGEVPVALGDRTVVIAAADEVDAAYGLAAGTLTLDLRELELGDGELAVTANVLFGELVVLLPPEVSLGGRARVAAGEVVADGRTQGGLGPSMDLGSAGSTSDVELDLDLRVGFGTIEVRS